MRPTAIFAALIGTTILAAAVVYPAFARGAGGQAFSPNNGQYSSYAIPPGFSNFGDRAGWNNAGTPPGSTPICLASLLFVPPGEYSSSLFTL